MGNVPSPYFEGIPHTWLGSLVPQRIDDQGICVPRTCPIRPSSRIMLEKRKIQVHLSQGGTRMTRGAVPLMESKTLGRILNFRLLTGILASMPQLVPKSPTSLVQDSKTPRRTYEKSLKCSIVSRILGLQQLSLSRRLIATR